MDIFKDIEFLEQEGTSTGQELHVFALSTCGFCKRALRFLRENHVAFSYVYFDDIDANIKEAIREQIVREYGQKLAFPCLIIDRREAVVGFNEEKYRKKINLDQTQEDDGTNSEIPSEEEVRQELDFINNVANYKNWNVNADKPFVTLLADGFRKNRQRYGYYLCPCRDTGGSRKADQDIVCPCEYSDFDVPEYGHCYCGLFLSEAFAESGKKTKSIPERRNLR